MSLKGRSGKDQTSHRDRRCGSVRLISDRTPVAQRPSGDAVLVEAHSGSGGECGSRDSPAHLQGLALGERDQFGLGRSFHCFWEN